MNKTIIILVVALCAVYLLGFPQAINYMTIATAVYAALGAVVWLFTQQLPAHFIRHLLLIFIGPMALVAILNFTVGQFRSLEGHAPAVLLLVVILIGAYLGQRLWQSKSQRLF